MFFSDPFWGMSPLWAPILGFVIVVAALGLICWVDKQFFHKDKS